MDPAKENFPEGSLLLISFRTIRYFPKSRTRACKHTFIAGTGFPVTESTTLPEMGGTIPKNNEARKEPHKRMMIKTNKAKATYFQRWRGQAGRASVSEVMRLLDT